MLIGMSGTGRKLDNQQGVGNLTRIMDSENDLSRQKITMRKFICHLETQLPALSLVSEQFVLVLLDLSGHSDWSQNQGQTCDSARTLLCRDLPILSAIITPDKNNQNVIPALW